MPLNVLRDRQETQAIADFARTQPAAMATPASTSPTVVPTAPATSRITDVPGLRLEDIANANVVETPRSIGSRAMSALLQPNVLAPVAGGVADVIGSYQDRLAKQEEIRLKEEQMKREQEAQARLAQLLMPMFQQTVRQYSRPQ
jgi:hypothetical protein